MLRLSTSLKDKLLQFLEEQNYDEQDQRYQD